MKLRKQLFGYNKKQISKIIDDYEKRISSLQDDNLYLREKIEEIKEEKNFSRDKIVVNDVNSSAYANIGLVNRTVDALVKANEEYAKILTEIGRAQDELCKMFYGLVDMIGEFQIKIREMDVQRKRLYDASLKVDEITREALDDLKKTTRSFEEKTGSEKRSSEKIGFAEFLMNHSGEGSVVDLLQVYVKIYNHD